MITLGMGVGMISGGWLADRVPRSFSPRTRRALVPVIGMIASGSVFELGLLAPSAQGTLVAFVVAAALLGLCEAGFWTTVVELGGPFGGTAAGSDEYRRQRGRNPIALPYAAIQHLLCHALWQRRGLAARAWRSPASSWSRAPHCGGASSRRSTPTRNGLQNERAAAAMANCTHLNRASSGAGSTSQLFHVLRPYGIDVLAFRGLAPAF